MPFQASKLVLPFITSSSSPSISSLLFEHSSNSLLLSLSDSSHLLFPSFSSSSPSTPPTTVPPASTAVSFLRLLPTNRVLFFAASPLDAGASLSLRAWILHLSPSRFVSVRLTYKKSTPATLPLAHGFGVRLIGTVNYFVVHAPAASQIWVMAARIDEGVGKERVSVDLVKCAVVDCHLPIYSIGMSMGVMVLGEIGGIRVFPMRVLVKGLEFKGNRKGHLAVGKSGDRLFELGKRVVPNGVLIPVSRPDGGASARVEILTEEISDKNQVHGKLRCARLRQNSGDLCSFFIKIKCNNTISECNTGAQSSLKAISIHVLSQKQFLILDSTGDNKILGIVILGDGRRKLLVLTQQAYLAKVLKYYNMSEAKGTSTSLAAHFRLSKEDGPKSKEEEHKMSQVPYSNMVGSLMYAMICTIPDLAQSMSLLSRFMARPGRSHWEALKWVLRYVRGTVKVGLRFNGSNGDQKKMIVGYTDSDYAGCLDNRKSTSGYVFTSLRACVSWKSSLQNVVALSTTEAEFIAATEAIKEGIWMGTFVKELGYSNGDFTLYSDSQSALHLMKNPVFHERSKHIDVKMHFIRDMVEKEEVKVDKINTEENPSDMMTKTLPRTKLVHCMKIIDCVVSSPHLGGDLLIDKG